MPLFSSPVRPTIVVGLALVVACGDPPAAGVDAALVDASFLDCNSEFSNSANPAPGIPVTFTPAMSSGPGAMYQWSFAGGAPANSTAPTPSSTFAAGNHVVSLTVSMSGCATTTSSKTIDVGCPSGSRTFSFTGAPQDLVLPACVTRVTIDAYGASGGAGAVNAPGGKGGHATGTLTVGPSTMLSVWVGGEGTQAPTVGNSAGFPGGFNGGGGVYEYLTWTSQAEGLSGTGGGASDVRLGGAALANRIIVAGGGGGGASGGNAQPIRPGADGGGLAGATAVNGTDVYKGGGGGSQVAGGATNNCCLSYPNKPGVLGVGGDASRDSAGSGGGGGGYYGGGGGQFAGGGGGSSFIGTLTNASTTAGINSGPGRVVVTW